MQSIKRLQKIANTIQVMNVKPYKDGDLLGIILYLSGIELSDIESKENEIIEAMVNYVSNNDSAKKIFVENLYNPLDGIKDEDPYSELTAEVLKDVFYNSYDPDFFEKEANGTISYVYSALK